VSEFQFRSHTIVFSEHHHSVFTLALNTGAFAQLVLTLAAIASRMYALIPEIEDTLFVGFTACHQILKILDVRRKTNSLLKKYC